MCIGFREVGWRWLGRARNGARARAVLPPHKLQPKRLSKAGARGGDQATAGPMPSSCARGEHRRGAAAFPRAPRGLRAGQESAMPGSAVQALRRRAGLKVREARGAHSTSSLTSECEEPRPRVPGSSRPRTQRALGLGTGR